MMSSWLWKLPGKPFAQQKKRQSLRFASFSRCLFVLGQRRLHHDGAFQTLLFQLAGKGMGF